jgi:acyl-CoA synthetase (NDP forming)
LRDMAEAAVAWGLQVPALAAADSERIKKMLLPFAPQPWNPVDTAADTRPMPFARVLDELLRLEYIDGVIMMPPFAFSYQLRSPASVRDLMDATEIVCGLPEKYHKPLIGNMIPSIAAGPSLAFMQKAGIPFYATQDESARAMHALVRYGKILSTGM